MNPINELRDYLLKNYVNGLGDLDIRYLDFSDFDGDVLIGDMKVKGDLHQGYQTVKGDLWQGDQKVEGDLMQGNHKVEGSLWQSDSTVKEDYYCEDIKVGGGIYVNELTQLLKKVTKEELAEMGYEVID